MEFQGLVSLGSSQRTSCREKAGKVRGEPERRQREGFQEVDVEGGGGQQGQIP